MTSEEAQPESDPGTAAPTILVVEDEVLIRVVICDLLREAGLRVVEAANADEALMYVSLYPSVKLVFSDVRMPGTMDGIGLARRLKADFPHIRTVLASGHLLPSEVDAGTLLVPKPYPVGETAARLIAILDSIGPRA